MLKHLRVKFVLVNMTIVIIMLGAIFGLLYYSTGKSLERESLQMLGSAAMSPLRHEPPGPDLEASDIRLPYLLVNLDRNGAVAFVEGAFYSEDEAQPEELIKLVEESGKSSGVLKEYSFRYLCVETPMGQSVVFADMTSEETTLSNLVRTFAITGVLAIVVFLGISIMLSFWAVKPVEKSWKQQKQFVADASHELKTPLTVIMTDAELLNSPECSEEDRLQLSGSIVTMSVQMRGLVEGMLELARIDGGNVKNNKTAVNFSETALNACMMFEPLFFEKDLPFGYTAEPDIILQGNEAGLKQVIEILLDNAIKYSSPGGSTELTLQKSSSKKCLLTVSDMGETIPPEELENLFKRFYRVDKARTRSGGYGLGLSIAESIAAEHRGRMWAESKSGINSFYLELPL